LCAQQGYLEKSAGIYRSLLKTRPANEHLKQALAEVEAQMSEFADAAGKDKQAPERLESLVQQWVSLMVERDLKRKFDDLRRQIKDGTD